MRGIRQCGRKNRKSRYGVMWRDENGNRKGKWFETKGARNTFRETLKTQVGRQGLGILEISAMEAGIMKQCLDLTNGDAWRVLDAVQEVMGREKVRSVDLAEARRDHIKDRENR